MINFLYKLLQNKNVKHLSSTLLKSTGFTLVELTVTIAIIVILSAILIPNYRGNDKQLALYRAASKLTQDIRRVQQMAISTRECCGVGVPARYGIEFTTSNEYSYVLFADINDPSGNGKRDGSDPDIETINLEQGISINQLYVADPPSLPVSKNSLWITFTPPAPIVDIRDPSAGYKPFGMIELTNGSQTKTIKVNLAGLIYVED